MKEATCTSPARRAHHLGRLALLTALLAALLGAAPGQAQSASDPYANAIGPGSSLLILSSDRAVGQPDGLYATVVSLLNGGLVLDMGAGEEGTGDLRVYYGNLNVELITTVDFMRADGTVISSTRLHLVDVGLGTHIAVAEYSQAPTPYRYVRLRASLLAAYQVDAVEAAQVATTSP